MKIIPKKSLGQNFLIDQNIINKIIKIGKIAENKTVLEIGPGYGNLTRKIANMKPKKILAIEKDKKLQTKMLLQIHDELIFECSEKDEEYVKKTIKDAMISISKSEYHMFSIPLDVHVNSGYNWGEIH